jgi:hypothetical protein
MRAMSIPKGMLEPGIEAGRRNGIVKIMQSISWPRSPNRSTISRRVSPSAGIVRITWNNTAETR